MHHCEHGFAPSHLGWLIAAGVVVALLLVLAFVFGRSRRPGGVPGGEDSNLDPLEDEILGVLRETGESLSQAEITDILSMDPDDVAEASRHLESRDLIRREWCSGRQTYMVTLA